MPHWAEVDENGVVLRVTVGQELEAGAPLSDGVAWIQTSYNTRQGVHYNTETGQPSADQSKAFRGNYAGLGFTYDEALDGFIPPQPYPSWVLDEETFSWVSPVPMPEGDFDWDESAGAWVEVEDEAV
jgi:hypothetical protein